MLLSIFYNKEAFFLGLVDVNTPPVWHQAKVNMLQATFSQMDVNKFRKQDTNACLETLSASTKNNFLDKSRRLHNSAQYIYVLVNPKKGRRGPDLLPACL